MTMNINEKIRKSLRIAKRRIIAGCVRVCVSGVCYLSFVYFSYFHIFLISWGGLIRRFFFYPN